MVVPVLMTNCQVSEKLKNGPDTAHTITIRKAVQKAVVLPVAFETCEANFSKELTDLILVFFIEKGLLVDSYKVNFIG